MKIPDGERAVVDAEKVRDYLLSPVHPVGKLKAAFFGALGYTHESWADLQRDLAVIASLDAAFVGRPSPFGTK